MDQIINQLIDARKNANLTLEDIQQRTKIPLRQLEYLEAGQLDKIGPDVYVKGFVRRYAQEVGIDPETLWEREAEVQVATPSRARRRKQKQKKNISINFAPLLRIITIIALVVMVGILIRSALETWLAPGPDAPPDVPPGDEEQLPGEEEPDVGDDEDGDQDLEEPEVEVELVDSEEEAWAHYIVHEVEVLEALLTFSGDCWVRVTVDGERVFEGILGENDEEFFTGEEVIHIRFGAPIYAQVLINDVEVQLPEKEGRYEIEFRLGDTP